jgi:quinol monooxygenase YgiN
MNIAILLVSTYNQCLDRMRDSRQGARMIFFLGRIVHATEEAAARALKAAIPGTVASAAEPGCPMYTHALDCADPKVIWILHVYESIKDVQEHLAAEYYPQLNKAVTDGAVTVEVHQYVGMEAFHRYRPPTLG